MYSGEASRGPQCQYRSARTALKSSVQNSRCGIAQHPATRTVGTVHTRACLRYRQWHWFVESCAFIISRAFKLASRSALNEAHQSLWSDPQRRRHVWLPWVLCSRITSVVGVAEGGCNRVQYCTYENLPSVGLQSQKRLCGYPGYTAITDEVRQYSQPVTVQLYCTLKIGVQAPTSTRIINLRSGIRLLYTGRYHPASC